MNVLFNLLVMEEDEELERQMLNLSPSLFDTGVSRWIIKGETVTLPVLDQMSPVLSGPPAAVQGRAAVDPTKGFSSSVRTEDSVYNRIHPPLLFFVN